MNSPLRVVLWACLLIGATQVAHAQEASVPIARIYQSALENSPLLKAHAQRMDALQAARRDADRLGAGPLTLEGSYRSDRSFDNQGLRETEIGISAPLWLWNERGTNQTFRQAELQAGEIRQLQQQLELAGQVRQVVWNTLAAHLDTEIARVRLLGAKKLMDDVGRRVDAGDLAKADLLQASALHAQTQAELVRAMSVLSSVGAEFSEVTGLPVSIFNSGSNTFQREEIPANSTVNLDMHPVYLALQGNLKVAETRADLLAIQTRENPELGLAVINERAGFTAPNERSLLVSTRIPLGFGAAYESRLLAARADVTEAQIQLKRAAITLKAQASAASANLQLFEQLQANAQEQARLAGQVYAMYQRSFDLGETSLPTLLGYEQRAFEAERLAQKSIVEYSAKVSALRQVLGLLPEQAP